MKQIKISTFTLFYKKKKVVTFYRIPSRVCLFYGEILHWQSAAVDGFCCRTSHFTVYAFDPYSSVRRRARSLIRRITRFNDIRDESQLKYEFNRFRRRPGVE